MLRSAHEGTARKLFTIILIPAMLEKIIITNFRCYEKTTINFNGSAILVGKNNAGKSTLIEALKILSTVSRKYKTARFVAPPDWVEDERSKGITPNLVNMNIADHGIFNMYGNPPAIVEGYFTNGTSIKAYVGEELAIFAVIYDDCGIAIKSGAEAKRVDIPTIEVLPQISAVLDNEKVIQKSTVDNNRFTRLASRNFRNQLFYYDESYPVFKELVESTWETLQVKPVEAYFVDEGRILQFFVRVNNFEAEIGWMGHGLQMWIQTMWFVSQCGKDSIVVLDEPDVYMHADLQRRLIRLITPMFPQLIIATHSLEIIEEVTSDCIIPIDSSKTEINPIGEASSLQFISKNLGSSFNIDLARLFISNKLASELDVEVLASAFNMDKADLMGKVFYVDNFDIIDDDGQVQFDGSGIYALICDKRWFKIRTKDMFMDEFYNANNRSWQQYLNVIKAFNYSLFANAYMLVSAIPTVNITSASFNETAPEVTAGEKITLHLTTVPFNATQTVTFTSGTVGKATVEKKDDRTVEVTGVAAGSSTITATAGGSSIATVSVTVSAAD